MVNYPEMLMGACRIGNLRKIKDLIENEGISPCVKNNNAVKYAAINGYLRVVKYLLQYSCVDVTSQNNYAIIYAARHGRTNVVKFLLNYPDVNPADNDNYAICTASGYGHYDIVKMLLNDKRVLRTLNIKFLKCYNYVDKMLILLKLNSKEELEDYLKIV